MCDFYLAILRFFCTFAQNFKPRRSVKSERIYNFHLRQLHFIEAVNKLWKKTPSGKLNLKNLCTLAAATSPAPRFYVTPRHALDQYFDYKRTGVVCRKNDVAKDMYKCIFERYEKALEKNNGVEFRYSVMQNVLDEAAPSFFLSPKSAYSFYCRAIEYKRSLARK